MALDAPHADATPLALDPGPSIDALLRGAAAPHARGPWADVTAFAAAWRGGDGAARGASTVARAVRGGARADRLGYAFVAGYFAALDGLDPEGVGRTACVAATEVGGVHPRAIEAALSEASGAFTLRGQKTFVTLAGVADDLVVLARREGVDARGRKQLVALRIPADRPGVRIEARPATSFAPEVPHARVLLEDVDVAEDEVLPGDGWDDWLRPFRTVEDVHVLAATAGYLVALASEADRLGDVGPDLAAVVAVALSVERDGWTRSGAHLALEGAFRLGRSAHQRLAGALPEAFGEERRRLERDAPLLAVAEAARQKRLAVALERVAGR
jgi:hypothetical protein